MFSAFLCVAAALYQLTSSIAPQKNLIVDVGYARYQGTPNATWGVNSWFGIRYAVAPTGPLRWRPPRPVSSSKKVFFPFPIPAANSGPTCPQGYPAWRYNLSSPPPPITGREDCLLLDIVASTQPQSTKLPVLVQIHGGGYTLGNSQTFPGYAIVNASRGGILYVSIQYRLGAYGFLDSEEIRQDGATNVGLLDQRVALEWIQSHIGAFGGDPEKVTITGGSAGGGSVMGQLMFRRGAENPPFRAAIAEYPWMQQYRNTTRLEAQYQELLTATGCADLECLRSLTEEELIHGQHAALQSAYGRHYGYGDFWFGPTIDGDIIRDLPSNEFKKGYFSKVPFLTNRASYEGFSYTPPMLNSISASSDADLIADLKILYPTFTSSPSFLTRLLSLYPPSSYATLFYRRSAIFSDVVVNCPTYHLVSRMGDHMPAWKFVFRTGTQTHGADWRFLWDADFGVVEGDNKTVASMLKDYYIAFTTALDPNALLDAHTGKPEWPSYVPAPRVEGQVVGNQSFDILEFTDGGIEVVRDPDVSDVCDFWASQNWIARN